MPTIALSHLCRLLSSLAHVSPGLPTQRLPLSVVSSRSALRWDLTLCLFRVPIHRIPPLIVGSSHSVTSQSTPGYPVHEYSGFSPTTACPCSRRSVASFRTYPGCFLTGCEPCQANWVYWINWVSFVSSTVLRTSCIADLSLPSLCSTSRLIQSAAHALFPYLAIYISTIYTLHTMPQVLTTVAYRSLITALGA